MKIRQRVAALLAVCLGWAVGVGPAAAQGAPHAYAVVSEFGRDIVITVGQTQTGTRLEANAAERLPVSNGAYDKVALISAKQALEKADAGAKVWLVAPLDVDLFNARGAYAEGSTVNVPADLAAALKERGSSHLLLFTRLRDEASLRAGNEHVGSGQIEGVGFYIDRWLKVKNLDTLTESTGFIAPYLYIRATLIDARSAKVLATRRVTAGTMVPADRPDQSGDPWALMSSQEKVGHLSALIRTEVGAAVPALLSAP